MAQRVLKSSI